MQYPYLHYILSKCRMTVKNKKYSCVTAHKAVVIKRHRPMQLFPTFLLQLLLHAFKNSLCDTRIQNTYTTVKVFKGKLNGMLLQNKSVSRNMIGVRFKTVKEAFLSHKIRCNTRYTSAPAITSFIQVMMLSKSSKQTIVVKGKKENKKTHFCKVYTRSSKGQAILQKNCSSEMSIRDEHILASCTTKKIAIWLKDKS